ncbi:MAG: ribosome small subunit-dependent GTPase A [Acholeplasmatales bacterium]
MKKAKIIKLIGGLYSILDLETNEIFDSRASGKLRYVRLDEESHFNVQKTHRTKLDKKIIKLSPKVGDIVLYDDTDSNRPIQEILPRKNELNRPDVANVDQVLLIFSTKKPDFSFNLLDQFLVLVEEAHIKPIIVISKIDLLNKEELKTFKKDLNYYENVGYELHYVNSHEKIGFDVLKTIFKDKVSVVAGQTGVGKSTLINILMPDLALKTQEISEALGRGKHTTRHTELFFYQGGFIADTPGFSKLEFNILNANELKDYFIEFNKYKDSCRFKDCNHIHEPGCNIRNNPNILPSRIENYHKFYEEIATKKEIY